MKKIVDEEQKQIIEKKKTPKYYNRVVELYVEGLSYKDISKELEISIATVGKYVRKAIESGEIDKRSNITYKIKKDKIRNNVKYMQTIELYKQGDLTQTQIAAQIGVTQSRVSYYIKKAVERGEIKKRGKCKRKSGLQENPKYKRAIELYKQGNLQQTEIAKQLNVTPAAISYYINYASKLGEITKKSISQRRKEIEENKKADELENIKFNELIMKSANLNNMSTRQVNEYATQILKATSDREEKEKLTTEDLGHVDNILVKIGDISENIVTEPIVTKMVELHVKLKDYQRAIFLLNKFQDKFIGTRKEEIVKQIKEIKRKMDAERAYKLFLKGLPIERVQSEIKPTELLYIDLVGIMKKANEELRKQREEDKYDR